MLHTIVQMGRVIQTQLMNIVLLRSFISRRMRWAGHVSRMGEEGGVQGLAGETGGKETTRET